MRGNFYADLSEVVLCYWLHPYIAAYATRFIYRYIFIVYKKVKKTMEDI